MFLLNGLETLFHLHRNSQIFCLFCVSKKPLRGFRDVFRNIVGRRPPDVHTLHGLLCSFVFQKNRSTDFCTLLSLLCFKKPLYGLLCPFVFQKNRSTDFCTLLSLLCLKKPIYGLLCPFVSFAFQKNRSTDFCTLLSLLCFKNPIYGLLCPFVSFVFQKPRSTDFCALLSLLCLKKTDLRTFVPFCVSKKPLRGFRNVFRNIVGRGPPDVSIRGRPVVQALILFFVLFLPLLLPFSNPLPPFLFLPVSVLTGG